MNKDAFEQWLDQPYGDFGIRREYFTPDSILLARASFNHALELSALMVDNAPRFGRRSDTALEIRTMKSWKNNVS